MDGRQLREAANLTELNLDGAGLLGIYPQSLEDLYGSENSLGHYILERCTKLERLSMKNTVLGSDGRKPSQTTLMKLVRRHPTLQWLRSDLTQENIATLQQVRPEITFVID
jgi:lipopolysaccharide biosynthesis regulator YciM